LAEFGQRDLTGAAGEQHDAELMLELFDRRRQRGLRDEEPFRGAPIVQLFAEYDEVAQLAQRDVTARGPGSLPRDCNEGCDSPPPTTLSAISPPAG
jgi:hypothetical protein